MMSENLSKESIEWEEGFKIEQRYHISGCTGKTIQSIGSKIVEVCVLAEIG